MNLFNSLSWQMIFTMVIGLLFVVSGLSSLSDYLTLKKPGKLLPAEVLTVRHIERKDNRDRLIQYYWELSVRVKKDNRLLPAVIRSNIQYEKGDTLLVSERGDQFIPINDDKQNGLTGLFLALSGICIILSPLIYKRFGLIPVSCVIAAGLFALGCALIFYWKNERIQHLLAVDGTIDDLILFQTDKEKRYLITPKHWYPLIGYVRPDGQKRQFISKINSNYESSFKKGSHVKLYWNEKKKQVLERRPTIIPLIAAIGCFGFGVYGIISTVLM